MDVVNKELLLIPISGVIITEINMHE